METETKTPENQPPHEAPRPKIIRNREVDKAADAIAEDHILPLPPGKNLTWEQMQQYLALLTPGMWSHVLVYVYRVKPKIRRQLKDPNSPNYIDCLSEPFSMDYFISRHGGGKYSLQAVDTDAKRDSNSSQLFKCLFEINDVQHPPILNYEELELEARENKSYIAWLQNKVPPVLDSKGNVLPQPGQQAPATTSGGIGTAKEVLDILGYAHKMTTEQQREFRAQFAPGEDSLSKSVGQILLEKMKQDDPGKDWDRMMAFMEKTHKPDPGIGQIIQMQEQQNRTNLEYTKMLLESTKNQNTARSQFSEFREYFMFAREILGTGGRRSGWDTGLEFARDVGLPALQTIGATITNLMTLKNGGVAVPVAAAPAAPPPAAVPGVFDPYANPAATRAYASTLATQQPAQAPPPAQAPAAAPPPGAAAPAGNQLLALFQQYGNLVVTALNNGTPGYDFADYISGLLGNATHAMLAGHGEEALATTMLQIPEIAFFGEPRIRTFVNEFVHYQEYLEEQEPAEEQPEPQPEVEMPKVYRPPQRPAASRHA
jgi:hypothetical protein